MIFFFSKELTNIEQRSTSVREETIESSSVGVDERTEIEDEIFIENSQNQLKSMNSRRSLWFCFCRVF